MKTNRTLANLTCNMLLVMFLFYSSAGIAQITVTVGTANSANSTTDYPCPIQDFYYATRAQFLYSAIELQSIGIAPGSTISQIGWVVNSTPISGHLQEDYSISLLNTTVQSLNLNMWEPGAALVYGPANYAYPSGFAGNVVFPVAPFFYTGGNLIVEVCGGIPSGSFTLNPAFHMSTGVPFNASHQWRQDVATGCGAVDPTNWGTATNRPVLVISYIPGNMEVPTIEGDVYYDQNQNGIRDNGEPGIANHFVNVNPVNYNSLTDANGHYKFYGDTAAYAVSWVPVVPWTLTSSPAVYSVTVPPNSTGNDFGIYAPPAAVEYTQLVGYVTGTMRCNNEGHSRLNIMNTGLYPSNGTVTLIHSANLSFNTNSSTPGFTVSGDTVTWTYTSLLPGQHVFYNGNFFNGPAGDIVTFTYIDSVFDASWNFQHVYSNSFTFTITCSCDPNDKAVDPPGETSAHYTLMAEELMYTIRFQNTGNDTAFNVMLLDTLDASLDITTLQVLATSHPMSVQVAAGNALRFSFQNILLPDSNVDEPGSHGYVVYSINPLNGLMDGTIIQNTAHIIFDMNPAVVTNTTYNTMVYFIPTGIPGIAQNENGYIYPNPVTGEATIFVGGNSGEEHLITVYNSVGKKCLSETFSGSQYLLREKLPTGIYMLGVTDNAGRVVYSARFVRE
jgi:hypothetical protein